MRLVDRVLTATTEQRYAIYSSLSEEERSALAMLLEAEENNPWARYENDPVGFINEGLGESLWSKQIEIAESVVHNQRTAVAACHAPGKSHLSARIVAWWIASHAPGTALAITIAPTHRQVRNIIWPHIRRCHYIAKLPGEVLTQTWKIGGDVVAYGFSPSPYDEAATQGIHAPNLLIVVDEAGGIGEVVGQALEALMTGGNTRLLLLGNPPTDQEDSWFERCYESPLYNTITIGAFDTPNFTGETVGLCKTCPPQVESHYITKHLVDQRWVDDVTVEFGEDSPFVEARVWARFPRSTANKVIPFGWCERSTHNEEPLSGLIVRLGIDIASDGGDEFVIAKADGFTTTITHRSSGKANENAVDVAEVCLRHIREAENLHIEREIQDQVKVKIDTIGVGWGVVSLLQKWGQEGKHKSIIVPVNVAERAKDPQKFRNIRAELWWNGRTLLQPDNDGRQDVFLDVERKVMSQLAGPTFKSDSAGRIQIESKMEMKRRGVSSPDHAEAILLSLYDPPGKNIPNVSPIGFGKLNEFSSVNFGNSMVL
jgi:hypothetical protein